ncbi:cobalt ABC transporter permease [Halocynthiibacter styelae]|uniref:Cobalt ABC transporter permease n=1 Tax=Halocynthiibacter styelae TaxID=2761955 RepID=A0A8J7IVF0_9RHOB|nr:cobalt ABC transporter permease [Paenihalocynthiibacter styelae]MBI1492265.1 cobalt ABC transporter permease [Paenihalocynthiibacter styelae]
MRYLLLSALLLSASPAMAHKIIAEVFPAGSAVEGEIGFSNGDMAAGFEVKVFDIHGNQIGDALTDDDGFFTWVPEETPPAGPLKFIADLGAGHVAEMILDAEDVPGASPATVTPGAVEITLDSTAAAPADLSAVSDIVAAAVRNELRPIRRELVQIRERNRFSTILGGIGLIFGLFGAFFYFSARRQLKDAEK